MWPFPRVSEECLAISLHPDHVALALFTKTNDKQMPHYLQAYQSILFHNYEYEQAVLFNPTRLHTIIDEFVHTYSASDRMVVVGITGKNIVEKIVSVSSETEIKDIAESLLKSSIWSSVLLYQQDYKHHVYYLCGIPRELLFQLQLFAIRNSLDLTTITTPTIGYVHAYCAKEGEQYSEQRFGDQMMSQKNQIHTLITLDDLANMVRIEKAIAFNSAEDIKQVGELLGLFLVGVEHENGKFS